MSIIKKNNVYEVTAYVVDLATNTVLINRSTIIEKDKDYKWHMTNVVDCLYKYITKETDCGDHNNVYKMRIAECYCDKLGYKLYFHRIAKRMGECDMVLQGLKLDRLYYEGYPYKAQI